MANWPVLPFSSEARHSPRRSGCSCSCAIACLVSLLALVGVDYYLLSRAALTKLRVTLSPARDAGSISVSAAAWLRSAAVLHSAELSSLRCTAITQDGEGTRRGNQTSAEVASASLDEPLRVAAATHLQTRVTVSMRSFSLARALLVDAFASTGDAKPPAGLPTVRITCHAEAAVSVAGWRYHRARIRVVQTLRAGAAGESSGSSSWSYATGAGLLLTLRREARSSW